MALFRDSVSVIGNELYLMYGVHQESIVTPENIDVVRAVFGTLDKWKSIEKTDRSLKLITQGKKYGV